MAVRGACVKKAIRDCKVASGNIHTVHRSSTTPQPSGKVTSSMKMNAATYQKRVNVEHQTSSKITNLEDKQLLPDSIAHSETSCSRIAHRQKVEIDAQ